MKRTAIAVAMLLLASMAARAETIPLIEEVPAAYMPGTPFNFFVRIPPVADFTGYSVELVFVTDVLNPPLDVMAFPATSYPFASSAGFNFTLERILDSNSVLLTISDATTSGVLVIAGENDTLAQVVVTPDAELTGQIVVQVGRTQFAMNVEGAAELQPPAPIVIAQRDAGSPSPVPVATPPGLTLAGVGALLLLVRLYRVGRG